MILRSRIRPPDDADGIPYRPALGATAEWYEGPEWELFDLIDQASQSLKKANAEEEKRSRRRQSKGSPVYFYCRTCGAAVGSSDPACGRFGNRKNCSRCEPVVYEEVPIGFELSMDAYQALSREKRRMFDEWLEDQGLKDEGIFCITFESSTEIEAGRYRVNSDGHRYMEGGLPAEERKRYGITGLPKIAKKSSW